MAASIHLRARRNIRDCSIRISIRARYRNLGALAATLPDRVRKCGKPPCVIIRRVALKQAQCWIMRYRGQVGFQIVAAPNFRSHFCDLTTKIHIGRVPQAIRTAPADASGNRALPASGPNLPFCDVSLLQAPESAGRRWHRNPKFRQR